MMKSILLGLSLCLLFSCVEMPPAEAQSIKLTSKMKNLQFPVFVTSPPNEKTLYIVEQPGVIKTNQGKIFLDIRSKVDSGGEKGLLSLAFHPEYAKNGRFFVYYTTKENNKLTVRISEFKATKQMADPQSEQVLLRVPQPFANHNGGQLAFGADKYLYIGTGDGGSANDPYGYGQSLDTHLGKILRIDINGKKPYTIPADNPFVNFKKARKEIYAYGLRNPWRFSFDRQSGLLYAADVGQNKYEEVDIIRKGGNYGWKIMEGKHCFSPAQNCKTQGLEMPIAEYGHDLGNSITGGYVYRGKRIPKLQGIYLYGDFGSGRIWGLKYTQGKVTWQSQLLDTQLNISAFGEGQDGELYLLDYAQGELYQIEGGG